jgi:hypothetical protein
MATNLIRLGLFILTSQALLSASCSKDKPRLCRGGYSFRITSEWVPQKQTYKVGDTLYLKSSFPTMLTDQINTSMIIDYSNAVGIGGSYIFYELDSVNRKVNGAVSKFDFLVVDGSIANGIIVPDEQKVISYRELNGTYSFQLKVIPKDKGIFTFFISDLSSRGIRGKNCTNAGFSNTLVNTNKNIHLFEHAMGRSPASQYETERIYCFRVE